MDWTIILQAGVASGTVLLFATIGEIFAERSGVMNLGVEGMMLIGAMSAFSVTVSTGNPWLGVFVAMLAGGLLSQIHAFLTVTLQSDQVVSGFALTFLGTGISLVLGEGLSKAGTIALLPVITLPVSVADSHYRPDPLHESEHPGVRRLSARPDRLVLHQSHAARHASALGG